MSTQIIIEDRMALRDMPFTTNENEQGRKCTSCSSQNTRRVILNKPAFPTANEQAYIPVVEIENETATKKLGDIRFRMYLCKDCGHVDFYTHLLNIKGITR